VKTILGAVLVAILAGCGGAQAGDPCGQELDVRCGDSSTMLICDHGTWNQLACRGLSGCYMAPNHFAPSCDEIPEAGAPCAAFVSDHCSGALTCVVDFHVSAMGNWQVAGECR
jgi:hypothetical protein